MKGEEEKIRELEKALAESHLKNRLYEEIIDLANKKYKTDLKKSYGTSQSEESVGDKTASKSKRVAKRSVSAGTRTTRGSKGGKSNGSKKR